MLFFATCPLGVADLLAAELREFGGTTQRELRFGVEFEGTLETAYRACLWSRTANRILLPLGSVDATTAAKFYDGVKTIDWTQHLTPSDTLAVDFTGASDGITHTQFGALKTKDAIVDQFRAAFNERPSVDIERPSVRINVHANRDRATVSIDLSGDSLHRRGYRARGVAAPLKENLAAALLLRAGWPALATSAKQAISPMEGISRSEESTAVDMNQAIEVHRVASVNPAVEMKGVVSGDALDRWSDPATEQQTERSTPEGVQSGGPYEEANQESGNQARTSGEIKLALGSKNAFLDPMCGSGTLVIEAALIADDIAPGLRRDYFGFLGWKGHDDELWRTLLQEAEARRQRGASPRTANTNTNTNSNGNNDTTAAATATAASAPCSVATGNAATATTATIIRGYDRDPTSIRAALENIERAGMTGRVHVERRDLQDLQAESSAMGLLLCNPPYGERIGDLDRLKDLYRLLGGKLREYFVGWKAAVFTGNPPLARELGLRASRTHTLFNGAIECRLLRFNIEPAAFDTPETRVTEAQKIVEARTRPGAQMFANRLRKNFKALGGWARKQDVHCYRLYDADMPEYSFAIDVYRNDDDVWVYVQEYAPPETVNRDAARLRRRETLSVIPEVLQVPEECIFVRVRRRQEGMGQYEKLATEREFHAVREGPYRFLVNFTDYLDTGLFLDHRLTRRMLGELAAGKRFLNLFAYTGSATVYAIGGGARSSTTVDMSATYLDWAKRNLALNDLAGPHHGLVQADCLQWLTEEIARPQRRQYDLIFIDPPTFSRSKRMEGDFDVQRDHAQLLLQAAELLAPDGTIVFSNNYTRFKLDRHALKNFAIKDISAQTLPRDYERNRKIHCCFILQRAPTTAGSGADAIATDAVKTA